MEKETATAEAKRTPVISLGPDLFEWAEEQERIRREAQKES